MQRTIHHVRFHRTPGAPWRGKGFLIRAGRFLSESRGRLISDDSPWAEDAARMFKKHPEIESLAITDSEGHSHFYYRDPHLRKDK